MSEVNDLLKTTVPDGGFISVEEIKGSPVSNETVLEHIRESHKIDVPVFNKQPKREGSFIFVAGGATLTNYLDEIRERSKKGEFICTSNMTHDYLVDNGIIPSACLIIDPKERCKNYINKIQKETKYLIGTVCHPSVLKTLLEKDPDIDVEKLFVAYGIDDSSDIELHRELYGKVAGYNFLVGGTMAGLRAMPLAILLGFSKIEYYGFDSCFSNNYTVIKDSDPRFGEVKKKCGGRSFKDCDTEEVYTLEFQDTGGFYYAYNKIRGEDIQIAETPDGRRFLTSPVFAHQAKQFTKWADRYEGKLEIVCHGDSLSTHLLKCHWENQEKLKNNAGDRRWSEEYEKLQIDLHAANDLYGRLGSTDLDLVARSVSSLYHPIRRELSVLDYGCGNGNMGSELCKLFRAITVTNYDPFVSEFSHGTDKIHDISLCLDVLEHVEIQYIENTIKYIAGRTRYMAVFGIALSDAVKELGDGRNAHITQKSGAWWVKELSKRFIVVEGIYNAQKSFFICQTFEGKESLDRELSLMEDTRHTCKII